jgi:hypothetical protein
MYNVLEKLKAMEVVRQRTQPSPPGLSRGATTSGGSARQDVDGRDTRAFTPVFDGLLPGHDGEKLALTDDDEEIKDKGLILILIEGVLASLNRLGHVTTRNGKTFEIRRTA